jgi:hypothetical protein
MRRSPLCGVQSDPTSDLRAVVGSSEVSPPQEWQANMGETSCDTFNVRFCMLCYVKPRECFVDWPVFGGSFTSHDSIRQRLGQFAKDLGKNVVLAQKMLLMQGLNSPVVGNVVVKVCYLK